MYVGCNLCRPDNRTAMATTAVAAWTACIKEMQQLLNTEGALQRDAYTALVISVAGLQKQPPLPHAAWKRLVQDVQVTALLQAHVSA